MLRLQMALNQIQFARKYCVRLIDQTDPQDWFRQPQEGVTHLAWQVGHLAMAQYRLALERIRGTRSEDEALIPPQFLVVFGKGSVPHLDRTQYPEPAEIRAVFDRVYAQTLVELPQVSDSDLDLPPEKPHSLFDTKLESLHWAAHHEMMHAGQIGLLRRLYGQQPLW